LRFPAAAGQLSGLPAGGGSPISDNSVLIALAAIAGPGLLAGILIAVPRIWPLAAGLPGLLLLGWTALYLVSVRQAVDLIPLRSDPSGAGFAAMFFNGILAAAGLAMILPMFVPSRWRGCKAGESQATGTGELIYSPGGTTPAPGPQTPARQPTQFSPSGSGSLTPLPAAPWPSGSTQVHQQATNSPASVARLPRPEP
jgi:hypothetical protein